MSYSESRVLESYVLKNQLPAIYEINYYTRGPGYGRPLHRHTFWQFFLVTKGTITLESNGDTHVLPRGQASLIPPHYKHTLYTDTGCEQVGINLLDDTPDSFMGIIPLLKLHVKSPVIAQVFDLADRSPELKQLIANGSSIDCSQACMILVDALLSMIKNLAYENKERFDIQLSRYLEKMLNGPLTAAQAAEHFHMSIPQLERLSRKYFGSGVISVYNRKRLNYAQMLLLSTNKSINEIAHLIGFYDAAHFSSFFSKRTGSSPTQYRKERDYESWRENSI